MILPHCSVRKVQTHGGQRICPSSSLRKYSANAAAKFTKEYDIMDVWFDNGVSHSAVMEQYDCLQYRLISIWRVLTSIVAGSSPLC